MKESDPVWPSIIDSMGVTVAQVVMGVYAFSVGMPYLLAWLIPDVPPDLLDVIKSNKSTVDLITTAVVMFYFGASVQRRKDQDTVSTLVETNAAQVAALAPLPAPNDSIILSHGQQAIATATESGAVIEPKT